jgi:hypothetical protein
MATNLKRVVFYAPPDVVDFLNRSVVAHPASSIGEIIRRAIRMAEYAESLVNKTRSQRAEEAGHLL